VEALQVVSVMNTSLQVIVVVVVVIWWWLWWIIDFHTRMDYGLLCKKLFSILLCTPISAYHVLVSVLFVFICPQWFLILSFIFPMTICSSLSFLCLQKKFYYLSYTV
jgi:hypothetical protein